LWAPTREPTGAGGASGSAKQGDEAPGSPRGNVDNHAAAVLCSGLPRIAGEISMKTIPPHLLLLPGLVCDAEVWEHQADTLSEITAISIADYGEKESLEEMARVALEGAPERFAVAGHSMGGRVALEIFRRAPHRVAALAILDSGSDKWMPGMAGDAEKAKRAAFVETAQKRGMRAMARDWVQEMVHPDRLTDGLLIASIIDMLARKTPGIFAAQNKALIERPDATLLLPEIDCPALVLCGREDAWAPLARHAEMAKRIPRSKFVAIEKCGHMAPMEQPEEVTAAMADWLRNPASASPYAPRAVDAKP
jgi:pimeloyl-ACP methyl ester carboxylesterase